MDAGEANHKSEQAQAEAATEMAVPLFSIPVPHVYWSKGKYGEIKDTRRTQILDTSIMPCLPAGHDLHIVSPQHLDPS